MLPFHNNPNGADLNGYIFFGDGSKSRVEMSTYGIGKVVWSEDRNGNRIEYSSGSSNGGYTVYTTIKDSLGRELTYETVTSPQNASYTDIKYKGTAGQDRIIHMTYEPDSLRNTQPYDVTTFKTNSELFLGTSSGGEGVIRNPNQYPAIGNLPTSITLPNNQNYQFRYNVFGQLARISIPTGGAIEYDYFSPVSSGLGNPPVNRVKEKRVYDENNVLIEKTVFSSSVTNFNPTPNTVIEGTIVTVERFDGSNHRLNKTKHYFYGIAGSNAYGDGRQPWWIGREIKTEEYDSNGTTLLRTTEQQWQQRANPCYQHSFNVVHHPCNDPNDTPRKLEPIVVETKVTLADANLVRKTTSINPVTGEWAFDSYNNPTDVWEYDYGNGNGQPGNFLRRTHTDYVTDSSYTECSTSSSKCLIRLPSQRWISSDIQGNNKVSVTQFEYDNYIADQNHAALFPRSSVIGHDTANFGTSFTKRGNVTAVTSYANAQNQTGAISAYSKYDILGNVVETKDGRGYVSTIDYTDRFGSPDYEARSNTAPSYLNAQNTTIYPLNGQSTFAFPTSGTNALNWTVGYSQFDYFTGQIVNAEDLNGAISKTVYNDSLDRPTQTATAIGTTFERQSSVSYYDAARRIEVKSDWNALNDNLLKSESFYDGLGRTVESRKYESDGSYIITKSVPFTMVQDSENSQWRAASKASNPYRSTDTGQPVWTTSLSDELGRVIKVITPDGAIAKTEYNGNAVTVTDQAGKKRRSITNALGQLSRVDEPNDQNQLDVNGVPAQPTSYEYDALNNLKQVKQIGTNTQQCGGTTASCTQTRTFIYDSLSRLKSANNPESGLIQYQYDNNGNLTTKTDARGVMTSYTYDALNRIGQRSYSAPNNLPNYEAASTMTYTYDNLPNAKGRLIKVENANSKTEYQAFDILGRVTQSQQTTDGMVYGEPMTYTYNLSGALVEQKYPSGRVVRNVLDNNGDLSIVQSKKNQTAGFWNYADNFKYTAAGAVSSMQLGNGRWESTQFNSRLQPTQIAVGTVRNGTDKLKLDYEYGTVNGGNGQIINGTNNGNVGKQTITAPTEVRAGTTYNGFSATQYYAYDSLNRLQSAAENLTPNGQAAYQTWRQTFTYDRYGNRNFDTNGTNTTTIPVGCAIAVCNPQVDPTTNKLAGYQYDASGNTKTDANSRKFTYDAENKQTKVETLDQNNNVAATNGIYFYDGDGRRVKKIAYENNQIKETIIFIYDAAGKLVAEYSNQIAQTSDAKVSYLTADHLGSPRINTDQNGAVTARHDYQPFGEEIQRVSYGADTNRKQFATYERDKETDLDFAQARYYSNQHGRFTSIDPLTASAQTSNPQTFNRYTYVLNNPLVLIDMTGAFPTFSFSLYVRSFAPFDWFGPRQIAKGDNRGFSTAPDAKYRISSFTRITADGSGNMKYNLARTEVEPPTISTTDLGVYSWSRYSPSHLSDEFDCFQSDEGVDQSVDSLAYHTFGNDRAIPGSSNIDLYPSFSWNYQERNDGSVDLTVSGTVTGDQFPAAEAFIRDNSGNAVMLGVFATPPGSTPQSYLPGNHQLPMINANVTVRVVNGAFTGVVENGKVVPLDEYNRRFTSRPAAESQIVSPVK